MFFRRKTGEAVPRPTLATARGESRAIPSTPIIMKVTKIGHCCLLIEIDGTRLLTDPGAYSTGQTLLKDVQAVIITHEHQDHLHLDSLRAVIKNNADVRIITNRSVGAILKGEGIPFEIVEHGNRTTIEKVKIEGFGRKHAMIHPLWPTVQNTGYFINNQLFYPGDSFYKIAKPVSILALPIAGPWMKISEAIKYAEDIKPDICFPVHDGMIMEDRMGPNHRLPTTLLEKKGIKFVPLRNGEIANF